MSPPHLRLRPARPEDRETIFRWASDPVTRQASFRSQPIPWEEHCRWYAASLEQPGRRMFLAEQEGNPVAFTRLDDLGSRPIPSATVSIHVAPEQRGRGVGLAALLALAEQARQAGYRRLVALIRPGNEASVKMFTRAGYRAAGSGNVLGEVALRYELELVSEEP